MHFTYDESQQMLTDSLRRLVADQWHFEARRQRERAPEPDLPAWQQLAELGMAGLLIPDLYGGFGESPATLAATHLELGRGLVSGPVIPSAVIATRILLESANPAMQQACLPDMAAGTLRMALAYLEDGQHDDLTPVATQARREGNGYVLRGAKKLVWEGDSADTLIVTAALDSAPALFLVPVTADTLTLRPYRTMDGARCAFVELSHVVLPETACLAQGDTALNALRQGIDYGIAALCAHAAGAMDRLIEITADYLKTRQQFGKPLAAFQVLQHALADMLIHKELAVSMAYVAAMALDETDDNERQRLLSSSKVQIARYGREIGQRAVQLHGGIGMTDELEVGDYFKRLTFVDYLLGSSDEHVDRLMALL